jgi:predicted transcriptional regulator
MNDLPTKPTSLKLPSALKAQLEGAAEKAGVSVHAFMIQTLADSLNRTQLKDKFAQDSADALLQMNRDGKGHELGAVREYFDKLAAHRKAGGAKPARLRTTKIA